MSQQINLYDASLLRKRELLTAANLVITALMLSLAMGAWGMSVRAQLGTFEADRQSTVPLLKGLQEQAAVIGKRLAEVKPDARLESELTSIRAQLGARTEVFAVLQKGLGSESPSFAEYLRGLARQTPSGLWLTGFVVTDGGSSMEIRGRMIDPASLPNYIQRLNGEPVFKGRAFSALKVSAGKIDTSAPGANPVASASAAVSAVTPVPATAPAPFHEFTLVPTLAVAPEVVSQQMETAPGGPQKLADLLPPDAARAIEGKR